MDPFTQGALGAVLPQSLARSAHTGLAMLCGFVAGMAPDLDVLISSASDPLLFLEYHRQFTHSLIFIPFGAGLVALVIWVLLGRSRGWSLQRLYLFCFLGYATHGLLDACTTYGTLLFWPFSQQRVSWNAVSIIDPLFTVPLLLAVLVSRRGRRRWPAVLGLCWALSYLGTGLVARDAAQKLGWQLAVSRGHTPVFVDAKPSFANIILWKVVYRYDDRYYVDAVRLGRNPVIYEGESVQALRLARDLPWLDSASRQAVDVERFGWFSQGYLALDPRYPARVMDLRYSLLPNEIQPLWSIELDPEHQYDRHVKYLTHRSGREPEALGRLWTMLSGRTLPEAD